MHLVTFLASGAKLVALLRSACPWPENTRIREGRNTTASGSVRYQSAMEFKKPFVRSAMAAIYVIASVCTLNLCAQAQTNSVETLRPTRFLLEPSGQDGPVSLNLPRETWTDPDSNDLPGDPQTQKAHSTVSKLVSAAGTRKRLAPRREDYTVLNFGNKHWNVIVGGLDQGAGVAFGGELTTADSIKGVEFRLAVITSTLLYFRTEIAANVPRVFNEKSHAEVWFDYVRRRFDPFYGVGNRTNKDDKTPFALEFRNLGGTFSYDLTRRINTGVYVSRHNAANYVADVNDLPLINEKFSGDPNTVPVSNYTPGLLQNTDILAYGVFAELDYRNDASGLTRGAFLYARLNSADSLNSGPRQDFGWLESQLDGRVYIPLGSHKTSLALRAFSDSKNPKGGSLIPFFLESRLGGRSVVRGFGNWRFVANNLLYFSGELRRTVHTLSETRGIDVVAIGDVGRAWGDTRSSTDPVILRNNQFSEAPWRAGYGGGVQFRYNQDAAFRLDLVHSPERSIIIYFSFSRGF